MFRFRRQVDQSSLEIGFIDSKVKTPNVKNLANIPKFQTVKILRAQAASMVHTEAKFMSKTATI